MKKEKYYFNFIGGLRIFKGYFFNMSEIDVVKGLHGVLERISAASLKRPNVCI